MTFVEAVDCVLDYGSDRFFRFFLPRLDSPKQLRLGCLGNSDCFGLSLRGVGLGEALREIPRPDALVWDRESGSSCY